jgi:hypothetical protein
MRYLAGSGGVAWVVLHPICKKSELIHDYPSIYSHVEDTLQYIAAAPHQLKEHLLKDVTTIFIQTDGGGDSSANSEENRVAVARLMSGLRAIARKASIHCPLVRIGIEAASCDAHSHRVGLHLVGSHRRHAAIGPTRRPICPSTIRPSESTRTSTMRGLARWSAA